LTAGILKLAGNVATNNSSKERIVPRHLTLDIRNDEELSKLFAKATIAEAGDASHLMLAVRSDEELNKLFAKATIAEANGISRVHEVILPQKKRSTHKGWAQDW
jgi:hypothetical protein